MAEIRAEMAANVWKILVEDGDTVAAGATVVILESMKMEIHVETEASGVVTLAIEEGQTIGEGDLIASVE